MSNFFKTVKNTVKYWYIPLIIGLTFIGTGIYTLVSPLESYVALSIIFSLSFLFSGLAEMVFSVANRDEIDNWGWTLAFGILTFLSSENWQNWRKNVQDWRWRELIFAIFTK